MDKKVKKIAQEIQSKLLLEENIPQLFNYMAEHYQLLSKVRWAMHYFAFYEAYYDDENTWSSEVIKTMMQVNQVIRDKVLKNLSGCDRERAIEEADALRGNIMNRMNALTAYVDVFQNFEYVLNRLEYRFQGEISTFDEEELSKDILRYIFDSEDNLVINEKIKEMIGQLPIRITKQKYFELLKQSLDAYLDAEGTSLDTHLYMIRTSAMLYPVEGMEQLYPELWKKKEHLIALDYKNMTQEDYEKAVSILQAATITLETETTVYYGLAEIVNELYALLLCAPYAGMAITENERAEKAAENIIGYINEMFFSNEKYDVSTDVLEQFTELEGVQEILSENIDVMENAFYDIEKNNRSLTKGLMLEPFLEVLKRTQNLLSNSLFVELNQNTLDIIVSKERIEKEMQSLENELTALFSNIDKRISRAVIANTINKLPVFFQSHKEVMDYVRYSIEHCSDSYEKYACYEIISDIIK
jgi:hypothetical protein